MEPEQTMLRDAESRQLIRTIVVITILSTTLTSIVVTVIIIVLTITVNVILIVISFVNANLRKRLFESIPPSAAVPLPPVA